MSFLKIFSSLTENICYLLTAPAEHHGQVLHVLDGDLVLLVDDAASDVLDIHFQVLQVGQQVGDAGAEDVFILGDFDLLEIIFAAVFVLGGEDDHGLPELEICVIDQILHGHGLELGEPPQNSDLLLGDACLALSYILHGSSQGLQGMFQISFFKNAQIGILLLKNIYEYLVSKS